MQAGLSGSKQYRIVVAQAINRPCPETGNDADQSVFAMNARRPAEFVITEGNARIGRQIVFSDAAADHFLNHDTHFFVEVQ